MMEDTWSDKLIKKCREDGASDMKINGILINDNSGNIKRDNRVSFMCRCGSSIDKSVRQIVDEKKGSGAFCKECMISNRVPNSNKSNTSEFIKKAKDKHGDKYDYSKVEYESAKDNVIIICKKTWRVYTST